MLYQRIKKIMDDIIDIAYADLTEEKRKGLKRYKLYILPAEKKKSGGRYIPGEYKIEVYNARLGPDFMAKVFLHELAHHLDLVLNHATGHSSSFYKEYARLIFASLDMGILSERNFQSDQWSSDATKVRNIVKHYVRRPVPYKPDFPSVIKVHDSFTVKDALKNAGYTWNVMEQVWEKDVDTEAEKAEADFLSGLKVQKGRPEEGTESAWYSVDTYSLVFESVVYIEASGKTYEAKDALKKYGFFYLKREKKWRCKALSSEVAGRLEIFRADPALREVVFTALNRKLSRPVNKNKRHGRASQPSIRS